MSEVFDFKQFIEAEKSKADSKQGVSRVKQIKDEFRSLMNKFNQDGEFDYPVYSELIEFGTELIQEAYKLGLNSKKPETKLEKENARLRKLFCKMYSALKENKIRKVKDYVYYEVNRTEILNKANMKYREKCGLS